MRFGIDLDGVLCDFGSRVVEIANSIWSNRIPLGTVPNNWDWTDILSKDDWIKIWDKIKQTPYFWEHEGELPGATELALGLSFIDEVYFITARARTVGQKPQIQSTLWLKNRNLYPRDGQSVVLSVNRSNQKLALLKALDIYYFLDDYEPTVRELRHAGINAYVLDQPWNRFAKDLPRVFTVSEYLQVVHNGY